MAPTYPPNTAGILVSKKTVDSNNSERIWSSAAGVNASSIAKGPSRYRASASAKDFALSIGVTGCGSGTWMARL